MTTEQRIAELTAKLRALDCNNFGMPCDVEAYLAITEELERLENE